MMKKENKENSEAENLQSSAKEEVWTEADIQEAAENYKLLELVKAQSETGNWDLTDPFQVPNPYK